MSSLSRKLMGTTAAVATDEFFNQTTLLLHGDGTSGGQNNTFLDGSTNNFTITRNGNTTQGSFSPYGDRWSNYFDGSGDYLSNTTAALIGPTVSTFTVEGWIYMPANPTSDANNISGFVALDGQPAGTFNYMSFGPISSRVLYLRWFDGAAKTAFGSTTLNLNQWYHIACVVNSNAIQFYVDGVAESMSGTTTLTNRNGTTSDFSIGQHFYGAVSGYFSDVRVTTTAVYTSAFTPPTAPLTAISGTELLTCQSNGFKDSSSNNFAMTRNGDVKVTTFSPYAPSAAYSAATLGGSGYFDGTGDYLYTGSSVAIGTSAFTLEAWIYPISVINRAVASLNGGSTNRFYFGTLSTSTLIFRYTGTSDISGGTLVEDQWNHVAVVREGTGTNQTKIYLNGVNTGTGTVATNYATDAINIGTGRTRGTNDTQGFLSDVRLVVGTAVYTSAFTPPTAPLTAVTNTSLLCSFTNAAIFDSTAKNVLETVGNAQIDTAVKKYGTGSMEFDGTGDYLVMPITQDLQFGSGDFTIEGWINVPSVDATYRTILSIGPPVQIYARSGTIEVYFNDGDDTSTYIVSGTTGPASSISTNTWAHFAVVRNGTTFTVYVDGVAGVAATGVSAAVAASATRPAIGIYLASSLYPYTGYIDDFRITKGVARYTAAFTPPDRAFPDQ